MQHKILPPGDAEITEAFAIGVFDGLGGVEQGEEAAYIAAESMARWHPGSCPAGEIEAHFLHMNREICRFAEENGIRSIGTTAAVLLFTEKEICAVNLGDSRIFVLEDGGLRQISKDDVLPFGTDLKNRRSRSASAYRRRKCGSNPTSKDSPTGPDSAS